MEEQKIPLKGESVIAVVSKIMKFGAYCRLPEYGDREVFLPIREVSSGWIKNIREFIHEGQKLVCSVIFYDKEKNTIDVSLKRVTPNKAKLKIREYNLEKRLTALFIQAVKASKEAQNKEALMHAAISEFKTYTNLVYNATSDTPEFEKSALPKKLKEALLEILAANKKQKKYVVSYIATIMTYNTTSGATELQKLMEEIKSHDVEIHYMGAPKYQLVATGDDYASAEAKINKVESIISSKLKKGVFSMEKEKLKKEREDIMSEI